MARRLRFIVLLYVELRSEVQRRILSLGELLSALRMLRWLP